TLPVLEAAHIIPYSEKGPHIVTNGLLLKSDFHTLFDDGYITVTNDYQVEVSKRLHGDYGNGKDYYKYHGQKLVVLPDQVQQMPDYKFLEWHNEHVYLG
ncbi:MAG: HNH endonuclease, partial [Clostridiaceae bacterium]|nr:HNH endonuclease [Clostridiaceae bacterium]